MRKRSAGVTVRGVLASLPDFALAGGFLITWILPYALGARAVEYYLLTILLEFIIVHSTAFMGSVAFSRKDRARRIREMFALGLFYTLFVVGFALWFGAWWPVYGFWALTLNRMLGVLIGDAPPGEERRYVRAGWALSVMFFVVGAFLTALVPVPELGITQEVRTALDLSGSGIWIDEPHRALAFGCFYFALTGVAELRGWARSEWLMKGVPAEQS